MPPKNAPRPGGRKGPGQMTIAQLKKTMELRKAEEERLKREAEEAERRRKEEERLIEEQRRIEEKEAALRREREKKEQQLQRKDKKSNEKELTLERMRAAGFILPDVEKIRQEAATEAMKPKPVPKPKAPAPKDQNQNLHPPDVENKKASEIESDVSELSEGEQTEPTESDGELSESDWEAIDDRDERRAARHARNAEIRTNRATRLAEKAAAKAARKAEANRDPAEHDLGNVTDLRSPICCVLGHVDTGKTSLLDQIRSTNVQGGEAGGITQQIGATFFPREALLAATAELNQKYQHTLHVPGLLIIDTPGHESFSNLRNRGSSLCDLAILVIDLFHGIEQQTRESLRLLREKKCPFIVVANKVDRLYDWKAHPKMDIEQTLARQSRTVQLEFASRVAEMKTALAMEGFNAALYYENADPRKVVSIVPTSAHTGEGVADLLLLAIHLVQQFMEGKVTYKGELQCTVLEVKPTPGYGFTVDVILTNGVLREGEGVCLCGQTGPIFTQIRALLTPQPLREMRVKSEYRHHKTIRAAMGVKVVANELEQVVPGTPMVVCRREADKPAAAAAVMREATTLRSQLSEDGVGVTVQSSTLGGLEALLCFLRGMQVKVGAAAIGPMHKRHLVQTLAMRRREPRYAVVLAFDVVVSEEAREVAAKNEITIFEAKVIYHLFDRFTEYLQDYEAREKDRLRAVAVFPVELRILDDAIHASDPIILPVSVVRGQLRVGTPLCAIRDGNVVMIGKVMSIERENKPVPIGRPGMEVSVKINSGETGVTFGRQFGKENMILSRITRPSVDAVKHFKDELTEDDVMLLGGLVKFLKVPK